MNTDNIRAWVEALRSGQYQQGTGSLRPTEATYCCLGVACEVAIKNGVRLDPAFDGYRDPSKPGSVYSGALPENVVEWLGLTGHELESGGDLNLPELPDDEISRQLAAWNDKYGLDFNMIADMIERNLLS